MSEAKALAEAIKTAHDQFVGAVRDLQDHVNGATDLDNIQVRHAQALSTYLDKGSVTARQLEQMVDAVVVLFPEHMESEPESEESEPESEESETDSEPDSSSEGFSFSLEDLSLG